MATPSPDKTPVEEDTTTSPDVASDAETSGLEEDIKELKLFLDQAQRARVKDLLQDDIKKLEVEASVAAISKEPVVKEETVPAEPQQKKVPTKNLDTYGDDSDPDVVGGAQNETVVSAVVKTEIVELDQMKDDIIQVQPKLSPQAPKVPPGKFLVKMNLLGTEQDICVLVKEEHRNKLMEHTQTVCAGLAKYIQDNGIPKEPLQLDLDSFGAQDKDRTITIMGSSKPKPANPAPEVAKTSEENFESVVLVHRHMWGRAHTKKLLELYQAFEDTMESRRRKYPIWQLIADDLNKKFRLDLTAEQCNQRFKNLKMNCRREIQDRERRARNKGLLGPPTNYHQIMCSILNLEDKFLPASFEPAEFEGKMTDLEVDEMIPEEPSQSTFWHDREAMKLLELVKKYKSQFEKCRNHVAIWKQISIELKNEVFFTRNGEQCRMKYKNMKKKFMRSWRMRRDMQERGEPVSATNAEYDAMFDINSQEIALSLDANETIDSIVAEPGDSIVQSLSIAKADGGKEKAVTMPLLKRKIIDSPTKSRPAKREKLLTIQKVQDIIAQSDVRLNETLLHLHAENKKIMEKLIDKL